MEHTDYIDKYSGTVLICGSAPSLFDEYKLATRKRPEAKVMAINDASQAVWGDFLVSLHPENMERFRKKSLNPLIITMSGQRMEATHAVQVWWPNANSGATSAYSGVQIARQMGFDEIILVGCPMSGGDGYFDDRGDGHKSMMTGVRFGNAAPDHATVKSHQSDLKKRAETEDVSMVRSMSGFTAEIFGQPEFML